jgi:acyl-CoA synthetase (AMP-forming)/AMP-acid ligase II
VVTEIAITNLADLIQRQATTHPKSVAITCAGSRLTYAELDKRATRVANGLLALTDTIQPRVAVLDKNSECFFELLFGAAKARSVLVPVNWRLSPPEIAYIVNDAGAEMLVIGAEFAPILQEIRAELGTVKHFIVLSGAHPEVESYAAWRDRQDSRDRVVLTQSGDVALQLYTSGTTGHPKGAQLTHRNLLAALTAAREWYPCTPDDVNLACLPQFHIAGALAGLLGVDTGAQTIVTREATPAEILRIIQADRASIMIVVPAVLLFMLQTPGCQEVDFSSLRHVVYGASPIAEDLLRAALKTFKCDFGHVYGLTETTGVITYLPPEAHRMTRSPRIRSCGMPLVNAEVRVVDATNASVSTGQVGEVIVRSPQIMNAYWRLPDATAAAIRDGWLYTGDAGYFDADGYLYIHDRLKDAIISGGENIYPAEVENALFGHPAVADVAVIGVPDNTWGEAVKGIVVLRSGFQTTPGELLAYCDERIAHYKVPKSIDFADSLPRNPSGKVLKRVLREPYWQGYARQVN